MWHLEWAAQVTADVAWVQRKFVSVLCLSAHKSSSNLEATLVIQFGGFSNLDSNHLMETQVTLRSCLRKIQMLFAWVACD